MWRSGTACAGGKKARSDGDIKKGCADNLLVHKRDPLNVCGLEKIVIPASVKKNEEEKYPAEHMTSLENKCDVTIQSGQLDGDSLSLLLYELHEDVILFLHGIVAKLRKSTQAAFHTALNKRQLF